VNDSKRSNTKLEKWQEPQETYRVYILTISEEEGGFSTIALNLPGAGSCGDTEAESFANAKEAIKAVLESYKEHGESGPWKAISEKVSGAKWINIHA
jgi:predicted RNase H-like HicB family nuclease